MTGPTDASIHLVDVVDSASSTESSTMIRALEHAWSAIRARHPEIPAVVIVVGAGSGTGPGLKLGHFAAMRWGAEPEQTTADGARLDRLPEVFVGGEGLARGPADVLATLLHEAAHALAHVRGIKDTSRQGRWHNARFKALADELGIAVTKDSKIGWSPTSLTDSTRTAYEVTISELGQALRLIRSSELRRASAKAKRNPPAVCGCGRQIRVAKAALATGPIVCGICGAPFEVDGLKRAGLEPSRQSYA